MGPAARAMSGMLALLLGLVLLPGGASALPARVWVPADFTVRTAIALDSPLVTGEYAWDDSGVPPGPVRVVVDLATQRLYVYRGGIEIGRTLIIYGADHKPTPTGVFSILQKDADHVSSTYQGAPMPYMLRLTWGGISIHGSEVDPSYATHGCVGVPEEFARLLFRQAKMGDRVLIVKGWMPALYGS